jgi:hypothetical protein
MDRDGLRWIAMMTTDGLGLGSFLSSGKARDKRSSVAGFLIFRPEAAFDPVKVRHVGLLQWFRSREVELQATSISGGATVLAQIGLSQGPLTSK